MLSLLVWTLAHTVPALEAPAAPLAQEPAKSEPKWTGSFLLGAQATNGNSDSRNANSTFDAVYERERDRLTLGFLWVYTETKLVDPTTGAKDWDLSDRKTAGRAKYDYFVSKETFTYLNATAENDLQKLLKLRWTAGAGVGHQFVDTASLKFAGEAGATHFDDDYYRRAGAGQDDSYVALRFATNTTLVQNDTWTFAHLFEYFPAADNFADYTLHSDLRATASLSESMVAQFQWIMDYDKTEPPANDSTDNRYLVSVGWKF